MPAGLCTGGDSESERLSSPASDRVSYRRRIQMNASSDGLKRAYRPLDSCHINSGRCSPTLRSAFDINLLCQFSSTEDGVQCNVVEMNQSCGRPRFICIMQPHRLLLLPFAINTHLSFFQATKLFARANQHTIALPQIENQVAYFLHRNTGCSIGLISNPEACKMHDECRAQAKLRAYRQNALIQARLLLKMP